MATRDNKPNPRQVSGRKAQHGGTFLRNLGLRQWRASECHCKTGRSLPFDVGQPYGVSPTLQMDSLPQDHRLSWHRHGSGQPKLYPQIVS